MELVPGGTLRQRLRERGHLVLDEAVRIALERLMDALLRGVEAERGYLYGVGQAPEGFECVFVRLAAGADPSLPVSVTLLEEVARRRASLLLTDLEVDVSVNLQASIVRLSRSEIQSVEETYFRNLVETAGRNITALARQARLSRMTIYKKLAQYGLRPVLDDPRT